MRSAYGQRWGRSDATYCGLCWVTERSSHALASPPDCRSACADSPYGQSAFRGETDGPRDIRGCRNPARTRCARGLLHPGAPRNARGSYGRTALRIVRLPFICIALYSYDQHLNLLKMSKSARRKRETPVCTRVTGDSDVM